jgi:hypothetical protein
MDEVEHVAKAIWGEWALWAPPITQSKPTWEQLTAHQKDTARRIAAAALAASNAYKEGRDGNG